VNRECKNCKHARLPSLEELIQRASSDKHNIVCGKLEDNTMVRDSDAEHSGFAACKEWEAYK
jgi:hypothetical protein